MFLGNENHHTCCMDGYLIQMESQRHDHDEHLHLGTSGGIGFPNDEHDNDFGRVDNRKPNGNQLEVQGDRQYQHGKHNV